jgi:superfamily I DNA and/or RNA helicase
LSQKEVIDEMQIALRANIEFLKREGSSQIKLRNGQLITAAADKYVYEFGLESLQNIEADADIEVRVSSQSATGKVAAINETSIQVELDKNLGATVPEAILIISSYYLLQMLVDKLEKVQKGEIKLSGLSTKVFGQKSASAGLDEEYIQPPQEEKLNEYQERALRLALGSDVTYLWGPPGTGKTQTIASIIEGLIFQNKSVLLIAHTNIATDEAMYKTVKHLEDSKDVIDGQLLREGSIQLKKLASDYGEYVIPDKVLVRKGMPVKDEIAKLQGDIDEISTRLGVEQKLLISFQDLDRIRGRISSIKEYAKSKQHELSEALQLQERLQSDLIHNREAFQTYQAKGRVAKMLSSTKPEHFSARETKLLQEIHSNDERISKLKQKLLDTKTKYQNLKTEEQEHSRRLSDHDYDETKDYVVNAGKDLFELFEKQRKLQLELDELAQKLILEAKVIATTLTKSYTSKTVLSRDYDCVILDEASMAPMPALFYAAGLAKEKVIVIGDFFQLPPVAKHQVLRDKNKSEQQAREEEELVQKWLMDDIFESVGIAAAVRNASPTPENFTQLKMQYRMDPDIAELVNKLVYGKYDAKYTLESSPTTHGRWLNLLAKEPLANAHIGIIDTSEGRPIAAKIDSGSIYSIYNALVCIEAAKQALRSGYTTVGIISAYRAQTNLIQKMVMDAGLSKNVEADTVHRFQGGEKQVIIFDVTTAQSPSMYDDGQSLGNDEKLLNVALSRAQDKLVVIADVKAILKKHTPSSLVSEIIRHCEEKGYPVTPAVGLLSEYQITEKTEDWIRSINSLADLQREMNVSELYDQSNFYQSFVDDLLKAEKEVIIDSPYITSARVGKLMPVFDFLQKKGVRIFIITRVPKEHEGAMRYQAQKEIETMEHMDITVLPFIGMIHRKIAVIDRRILWEGSLNILSQRESHEIMRRFDGEATAQQMITFLKLDKNIGKIGDNKLRRCEFCSEPGSWYWTDKSLYGGLWTFCLYRNHKAGMPPKSEKEVKARKEKIQKLRKSAKQTTQEGTPICPDHGLVMIKRMSRFGELWGCPRFPACRVIESVKVSS